MLIKYLKIEKNGEVIRDIHFKKGVNLIVDTTPIVIDSNKETGNNVGKTTVLRLIDYCLGAKAEIIYRDKEFKASNSTVRNFLEKQGVIISLCLSKFIKSDKCDIFLRRNFHQQKGMELNEINGENYEKDKQYCEKLNSLLFNISSKKPTFRQLITRFIRNDGTKMESLIKYLHASTADLVYESIYLPLFGIANTALLSSENKDLRSNLKLIKNIIKKTSNGRTSAAIKQSVSIIKSDIEELEKQKKDFNINPQYELEYQELQKIKKEINNVSIELSNKQFRLSLLQESVKELEKETSKIDTNALQEIYKEVQHYIEELHKNFNDVVAFHNKLISNKLKYISADINPLKEEIRSLKEQQRKLLNIESELGRKLIATGSLADYELIVSNANNKYEKKGRFEEELEKIEHLEQNIENINNRIKEISLILKSVNHKLEENITIFNRYFSQYSELFYGEKNALSASYDDDNKVYKFDIRDIQGNMGDGKRKGLIAAFDLAYISYANGEKINSPHFVIHDRIEGIHGNQLKSLFDLVNSDDFNGQYIASILSGKFSELQLAGNYLEENKILELSQSDKLFRIEKQS